VVAALVARLEDDARLLVVRAEVEMCAPATAPSAKKLSRTNLPKRDELLLAPVLALPKASQAH
jgi:hypothetical protein